MGSRCLTGAPLHVSNAHASLPHLLLLSPPLPLIHDLSTTAAHQTLTTGDGYLIHLSLPSPPQGYLTTGYTFSMIFATILGDFFVLRNRLDYVLRKFVESFWC
jgi:hypothetical protein